MFHSTLIRPLLLAGVLAGASLLPCAAADTAAAMPTALLQMVRRAAEPAYATSDSMLGDSRDLDSEVTRIRHLLDALQQPPSQPAVAAAWREVQPAAEKCGHLLQRMMQIEQSKPGNLKTFSDGVGLVQGLNHDSEHSTSAQNLDNALNTITAAKGLWDRIAAESDLSGLRREYRAAQGQLRQAAVHLHTAYDQSMAGSVSHRGFVGMVLENTTIKQIVPGSPAQAAGISAGDTILEVNGRSVAGMKTEQVRALLTGDAGTRARVSLARGGLKELERRRSKEYSFLGHNYHCSMNGTFFGDHLTLTNDTTTTLTNCLLRVSRLDAERKHITRVHYCASWAPGATLHFGYRPQSDYQPGENFDDIETIQVSLISEQMRDDATIDYSATIRAADYAANLGKATLSLSEKDYVKGILWDDHRGVRLTLGGVNHISPSRVIVTLHQSGSTYRRELTKAIRWEGSGWNSGGSKNFTDTGFDHIIPDGWKVELEFPHTTYRPTFTWGTCR
ncbi:PDZ domain-containing protein [Prosthecobacter sp.]|uniref:PDZ domain-containing protein n=1 Tax=Prosthecobacter sp. TaxID=1965333 RepID=UPI003784DCFD